MTTKKARDIKSSGTRVRAPGKDLAELVTVSHDIAERKRAEEALRESEERLRMALTAADMGTWRWDPRSNRDIRDASFNRILGLKPEESTQQVGDFFERVHPDDRAGVKEAVDSSVRSREGYIAEFRIVKTDGDIRWLRDQGRGFYDDKGEIVYMTGAVMDITERKRVEAERSMQEAQYRGVFEASKDTLLVFDLNGVIREVNPAACAMYGYSHDEMIGLSGKNIVRPDYQHLFREFVQKASVGELFAAESVDVRKDGSAFDIEVKGSGFEYRGSPHLLAVVRDITERKQAQKKLAESEQFLASVIEQNPSSIWISDGKGTLMRMNRACRELFGVTEPEVVGKYNILADNLVEAQGHMPLARDVFQKGTVARFTLDYDARDVKHIDVKVGGRKILDVVVAPIRDAQGNVTNAIVQHKDVTEVKRVEEALRQSEAKIRELADSITDVFFAMDKDLRCIYWNKASEEFTGIKAEDAIGKSIFKIFSATEDTKQAVAVYREVLTTQQSRSFVNQYQIGNKDFVLEISAYPSRSGLSIFVKDITERKRAEEERDRLINQTNNLICIAGMDGYFKFVNPAWGKGLGYTKEELLAKPVLTFIHPEDHHKNDEEVAGLTAGKPTIDFENRYIHKNGSVRHVLWTATPKPQEKVMYCIGQDITERKKAEEALRESEAKFKRLYDSNIMGIIFWDTAGNITQANREFLRIVGYTEEDVLSGKVRWKDITPPEYAPLDEKALKEMSKTGVSVPFEKEYIRKDGSRVPVVIGPAIFRGQKDFGICFVLDITERKRAEEELRKYREHLEELVEQRTRELRETEERAEREYTTIIQTALDGYWVNDLKGQILDVNDSYCKLIGYSREELLTMNVTDIKAYESPDDMALRINKVMRLGYDRCETRHRRKDGTPIEVEVSVNHIDIGGDRIIEFIRDISERKRMQEKLLASERLATLGHLSGNISHELRNPLGVIASSAYYLKSALKGNGHKVEQHLERIKNNVDSAVAIIDSLLNLTRLKPPQLERLDLTAIICDAIASAKLPPTVSLVRDFPEQGLLVDADCVQLPMCFKNIVKNAVEAMEGTGTLTVTVHRAADGQAEISFADTGPGIPTDNLTNIFQPLFSTKAKGIGFGLSIAKMIVERHGGIIEAKSEMGKGANIIIRLPLEAKQHMEDKHV